MRRKPVPAGADADIPWYVLASLVIILYIIKCNSIMKGVEYKHPMTQQK